MQQELGERNESWECVEKRDQFEGEWDESCVLDTDSNCSGACLNEGIEKHFHFLAVLGGQNSVPELKRVEELPIDDLSHCFFGKVVSY